MHSDEPPQELLDAIAAEPSKKSVDLREVRQLARKLHNTYVEKWEIEERLKTVNVSIYNIETKDLPELFGIAGIASLTVEAEGNHPAFVAEKETIYGAKIPDDKRKEALQWFDESGHGDLVKAVIIVQFGMHEHNERLALQELLSSHGYEYIAEERVHHMTLKAFVKRELEKGRRIPMDLLGASVTNAVKIKE